MHAARRLLGLLVGLAALALTLAPTALAGSSFDALFHEYQSTGSIKACKHSTTQLQAAKNQVPPDITQYAPDFPAALQSALEAHAHGVCGGAAGAGSTAGGGGGSASGPSGFSSGTGPGGGAPIVSGIAPGPTPAPIAAPASASPITTAAVRAGGGGASSLPAPLLALAFVLVAAAAAAVWWTVSTLRGGQPLRLGAAGHALGEVRLRTGGTLREFADWLRLGR